MVDQLALPLAISAFLFPALMIVAGAGDVLSMRIPNWLTVLVAVTFLPLALWAGLPPTVLLIHVATGIVALAGGFLLFSLGVIGGGDAKLLAVPTDKILPIYKHWKKPEDIAPERLHSIQHFFEHYKDLEKGKWVKVKGWEGPDAAHEEINRGLARYAQEMGA